MLLSVQVSDADTRISSFPQSVLDQLHVEPQRQNLAAVSFFCKANIQDRKEGRDPFSLMMRKITDYEQK